MNTIALIPPRPRLTTPRKQPTIPVCNSCDKALNATGECPGCTK